MFPFFNTSDLWVYKDGVPKDKSLGLIEQKCERGWVTLYSGFMN